MEVGLNHVTDLIAFYSKVAGSADRDGAVDLISMGVSKAFDCFSQCDFVQVRTLWLRGKF